MTDKLSHSAVTDIKLIVAKSSLKQMKETTQKMLADLQAPGPDGSAKVGMPVSEVKTMLIQLSNMALFTLNDLTASDDQITGIAHGGVPLDENEDMNYPAEMEETHDD